MFIPIKVCVGSDVRRVRYAVFVFNIDIKGTRRVVSVRFISADSSNGDRDIAIERTRAWRDSENERRLGSGARRDKFTTIYVVLGQATADQMSGHMRTHLFELSRDRHAA